MQVVRYTLGQLQANCYLLIHDKDSIVIDPGDAADFILEELYRKNLSIQAVVATHGHFDHVMAVGEIQRAFSAVQGVKMPFYLHNRDLFLVKRFAETAKYFLGYDPQALPPEEVTYMEPGSLTLGPFTMEVIYTPGHTPGSCCIYVPDENIVFTGDTLFRSGVGRTDFEYSSKGDLNTSIQRLFVLPGETIVYPGHGEETTIDEEKNNPMYME